MPNDIIGMSLMPSGPLSLVCGAQSFKVKSFVFIPGMGKRPGNQFRGSQEAWEPVLRLLEAWKYFFNPLPVLE